MSSTNSQTTTYYGFWRIIAQKTWFSARVCYLRIRSLIINSAGFFIHQNCPCKEIPDKTMLSDKADYARISAEYTHNCRTLFAGNQVCFFWIDSLFYLETHSGEDNLHFSSLCNRDLLLELSRMLDKLLWGVVQATKVTSLTLKCWVYLLICHVTPFQCLKHAKCCEFWDRERVWEPSGKYQKLLNDWVLSSWINCETRRQLYCSSGYLKSSNLLLNMREIHWLVLDRDTHRDEQCRGPLACVATNYRTRRAVHCGISAVITM